MNRLSRGGVYYATLLRSQTLFSAFLSGGMNFFTPCQAVCVAALPSQWWRIIGIRIFCTTPFFDLFNRLASFHSFRCDRERSAQKSSCLSAF
ncbi:hypothetical protein ACVLVH_004066 [Kluyvera sp. 1366]